jgi:hypothetical protein
MIVGALTRNWKRQLSSQLETVPRLLAEKHLAENHFAENHFADRMFRRKRKASLT